MSYYSTFVLVFKGKIEIMRFWDFNFAKIKGFNQTG